MKTSSGRVNLDALLTGDRVPSLISILSGKGGAGKSVIAYNLADQMVNQGLKCLLIDADWYFGNLHILANARPVTTLLEIIDNKISGDKSIIELNDRLHLIASPAASSTGHEFRSDRYARFLERIRRDFGSYDVIIFDTPSGVPDIIALTSATTDMSLIIVNPELTSIANNYGLLKLLIHLNGQISGHILVNRAESGKDSEYIYQKLAVLTGRYLKNIPRYAGYLITDQLVKESIVRQMTITELNPKAPIAGQFLALCKFITAELPLKTGFAEIGTGSDINSEILSADIKE